MISQSKQTAALYLGLVFFAGAVFGFSVDRFISAESVRAGVRGEAGVTPASEYRRMLVEKLSRELNLDDSQVNGILNILGDVEERWHALRDAMEPEFEALRQERASRILSLLDDRQRSIYERMIEERRQAREEKLRVHRELSHPVPQDSK